MGDIAPLGIDLDRRAQTNVVQIANIEDRQQVARTRQQVAQIRRQQHLIHQPRQLGQRIALRGPFDLAGEHILFPDSRRQQRLAIGRGGGEDRQIAGRLVGQADDGPPLLVQHDRRLTQRIVEHRLGHPLVVGIGHHKLRQHHSRRAVS